MDAPLTGRQALTAKQLSVSAGARLFKIADLAVDFLERLFQRLDELIDGSLSEFQIAFGCLLKSLQSYAREVKKLLIVVLECVAGQGLELFRKFFSNSLERLIALVSCAALSFEVRLQLRVVLSQAITFRDFLIERSLNPG